MTFDTDAARLDWLLWRLRTTAEDLGVLSVPDKHLQPLMICLALFRKALAFADGANLLIHDGNSEAVPPLERAIYELWLDTRHILRSSDPDHAAHKVEVAAALDVVSFQFAHRDRFGRSAVRASLARIRHLRVAAPAAYAEVLRQRKRRQFHWSGQPRAKIEQLIAPRSMVYKGLSWETHGVLAPIHDISVSTVDSTTTFRFSNALDPGEDLEWRSYTVGGMLFHMWGELSAFFGLPTVDLPQHPQPDA